MPKSQIIKDIVENNVSLEQSLNRLFVLANDVKNKQLAEWVQKELNGYKVGDDLPGYRQMESLELRYSGINGRFQVTKNPLPAGILKKETAEKVSQITMYDGIRYIEDLSKKEEGATRDLSFLAGQISTATNGLVTCTSIYQIVPQSFFQSICAAVRNKMIIALLELEKKYGNLDSLGIDISNKKSIQLEADNADLNRAVFNINVPSTVVEKKEPWYSKIGWNVVVPTITAVLGAVIAAIIMKFYNL